MRALFHRSLNFMLEYRLHVRVGSLLRKNNSHMYELSTVKPYMHAIFQREILNMLE